jgi:hypothetical protein
MTVLCSLAADYYAWCVVGNLQLERNSVADGVPVPQSIRSVTNCQPDANDKIYGTSLEPVANHGMGKSRTEEVVMCLEDTIQLMRPPGDLLFQWIMCWQDETHVFFHLNS